MPKTAAILLVALASNPAAGAPLAYRVWQLQDYQMDHIRRLIDMAAAQDINHIQISHHIVMEAEGPLGKPELARDINTICDWAHAHKIKVDMWTHELTGIPKELTKDGKANIDDPKLWEFMRDKYDRLFKLCPKLDGLVLSMQETAMSIYSDAKVASSIPPAKRVAELIDSLDAVCRSFGKDLFVRTFAYEPEELRYIQEGLRLTKSEVVVMSKCVPHDWQPYYPESPEIGDVGGKPQVVEFDLGHEFTGLSTIPYIMIDYLRERLDYGLGKKVVGAVLRVERLKWRSVDTPNQANIDVFSRMLADPTASPHKLYREWLAKRYPAQAVPHLYSAFMRTFEIVNKGLYVLGFWVTNHSRVPEYDYAERHLRWVSTAKWDPSPHWKKLETELLRPTAETIAEIDAEKREALRLVEASIADIEKAKPFLADKDYAYLADLFQREKAMVVVWKAAMDVIFGIDVFKRTRAASDAQFLSKAADTLAKVTSENRTHLVKMAADYADAGNTVNVQAAESLVELARKTVRGES